MIRIVLLFLFLLPTIILAQEGDDAYYRNRKINNWGTNQNYWYAGLEGGLTVSTTTLENNLSGFLAPRKGFEDAFWNAVLGYSQNDKWQIEAGYAELPLNAGLLLYTDRVTVPFRWRNVQKAIPVRFKWRLFKIGAVKKVSGLYLTAGLMGMISSPQSRLGGFGVSSLNRINNTRPFQFDTIAVLNETYTTGKPKIGAELGVEFIGRVSKSVQVVITLRTVYANRSISSNSQLYINKNLESQSSLNINPLSYQLGFSLRYLYGFKQIEKLFDEDD